MPVIVLFRRELRYNDNTALYAASETGEVIIPVFIFTPEQVSDANKYKSNHAVRFMVESLQELDDQHPLTCFYGEQHEVIDKLLSQNTKNTKSKIKGVYANGDYTSYAIARDEKIKQVCEKNDVPFYLYEDILLNPIGSVLTQNGEYYQKYTPYKNAVLEKMGGKPFELNENLSNKISFAPKTLSKTTGLTYMLKKYSKFLLPQFDYPVPDEFRGGRTNALKKLDDALKNVTKTYSKTRDQLDNPNSTTRLSPYVKFGCLSIRELYNAFLPSPGLVAQLIWRDFYYNIGYGYPRIYENLSLKPQYDNIQWVSNKKWLDAWKTGTTGFPIVDAGMRELVTTGYMHNRARLITSGFLIKILLIDWREGEMWYSQNLVDIDRAVNNGNWQWSSSSGADSQPYFRIMNPWRQSAKFDPKGEYIKRWVPELSNIPAKDIHNWGELEVRGKYPEVNYPAPIVDYKTQRALALKMYQAK